VCITNAIGKAGAIETTAPPPGLRLDASPNPFNPSTRLRFHLPQAGPVRLAIYNVRGQQMALLVDRVLPAGEHNAHWAGQLDGGGRAASGIYFAQMRTAAGSEQRKLVLVK
jgi:hypothetical protein